MRRRVYFEWYGRQRIEEESIPQYAMMETDDVLGPVQAVCSAIERKTRLRVVNCLPQGQSVDRGKATHKHYQLTLGRPAPTGGYNIEGGLWISLPLES